MKIRLFTVLLLLIGAAGGIGYLFWQQEGQYLLPTPVPADYQPTSTGETVVLNKGLMGSNRSGLFLHFFNPDCPCSRFNVKHFNYLGRTYGKQLQFAVIIPEFADYEKARELIAASIPVYVDKGDSLANASGVYATPQAVLLDSTGKLYYRGNYNKARYCTQKSSNYAEQALLDYLAGKTAPQFGQLASRSYGCQFFEEQTFSLLNF